MSGQHTPGPWVVDSEDIGGSFSIYPQGHYLDPWIADAKCEHVGPKDRAEIIANARLISAAPDLLDALKEILPWHDSHPAEATDNRIINLCRAAIAKAEGTAP